MKERYCIKCSNGNQLDNITFYKDAETGLIRFCMGYEDLDFTVKECREIIEKLKKCIVQ